MYKISTVVSRQFALFVMLSTAFGLPASAACFRSDSVQCREDFDTLGAVARVGEGFAAVGQIKTGSPSGLALLRLSRDGVAKRPMPIPWPSNLAIDPAPVAEVKKMVALPNGRLVLVSNIQFRGTAVRNIGWVTGIEADGRMWHRVLRDTSADIFLYGAHYDSSADRIIVVGKRQVGGDNGTCESWSQSFVQGLKTTNGQLTAPSLTHGPQQPGPTNRQGLQDIVAGDEPGTFVATGFRSGPKAGGGCQDNMLVGLLRDGGSATLAGGSWALSVQDFGAAGANDVAFAIKPIGRGRYLVAGHGQQPGTGTDVAQAHVVRLTPFAIEQSKSFPYPDIGPNRSGGGRIRAVIPIANPSRFVLAGSVSNGASGPNLAMWRPTSANLSEVELPVVFENSGSSDIFDGTAGPDGRVLLVGRGTDRDGTRMGWFGFVAAKAQDNVSLLGNSSLGLTQLTERPLIEGTYHLPDTLTAAAGSYLHEQLAEGRQLDLSFLVQKPRAVRISAQAASGDVDLLLTDASGRLVSFSNYRGPATEFVIGQLEAGRYTITLIAQSALRNLVIRVGPVQEIGAPVLSRLQSLSVDDRIKLSEQLVAAGYLPSPEPSIGFGSETAGAILATQENSRRTFGPKGIGAALTKQVGLGVTR